MSMSGDIEMLGLEHPAMIRRLANLLVARRAVTGQRRVVLAWASHGRWTRQNLIDIEAGALALDAQAMVDVAMLYGADLSLILPRRLALIVDDDCIQTGGVSVFYRPGDRESLLSGYLSLVRRLRGDRISPTLELRRSDVESLANYLGETTGEVLDDLAVMLGASPRQRKALAALLTTGVGVVSLSVLSTMAAHLAVGRGEEAAAMPYKRALGDDDEAPDDLEPADAVRAPIIVMTAPSVAVTERVAGRDDVARRTPDAGRIESPIRGGALPRPSPVPESWADGDLAIVAAELVAETDGDDTNEADDTVWSITTFDVIESAETTDRGDAGETSDLVGLPRVVAASWAAPVAGDRVADLPPPGPVA